MRIAIRSSVLLPLTFVLSAACRDSKGSVGSTPVAQLTDSERGEVCASFEQNASASFADKATRHATCLQAALYGYASDAQEAEASCRAIYEACMAGLRPDPASNADCESDLAQLDACQHTVDDVEACSHEYLDAVNAAAKDATCATLSALASALDDVKVSARCERVIADCSGPSDGGEETGGGTEDASCSLSIELGGEVRGRASAVEGCGAQQSGSVIRDPQTGAVDQNFTVQISALPKGSMPADEVTIDLSWSGVAPPYGESVSVTVQVRVGTRLWSSTDCTGRIEPTNCPQATSGGVQTFGVVDVVCNGELAAEEAGAAGVSLDALSLVPNCA